MTIVAAFVLAACAGDESPDSAASGPPGPLIVPSEPGLVCEWAAVLEVIDGDTIRVSYRGNRESVRLIGVDTPEVNHPDRGEEPFGREAAEFVEDTLDSWICLESDITNRDSFGRLLRYGWLPDTRLLNELLVARGLAQVSTFPPDVRHLDDRYLPAQDTARAAGLGIWSAHSSGECDEAYPDVCIPPRPPDLDCADIDFRGFAVNAPDPHNFDSDGNGLGCEN